MVLTTGPWIQIYLNEQFKKKHKVALLLPIASVKMRYFFLIIFKQIAIFYTII